MGLLLSVYSLYLLSHRQTNKQTIYSFNDIQAPGLHIIQCCNIYNTVIIMMKKKKTTKTVYIEDLIHNVRR